MRGVFCFKYFWRRGRFLDVVSFGETVINRQKQFNRTKANGALRPRLLSDKSEKESVLRGNYYLK